MTSPTCRQLGIQHVSIAEQRQQQQQQQQATTTTGWSSTGNSAYNDDSRRMTISSTQAVYAASPTPLTADVASHDCNNFQRGLVTLA